MISNINYGIGNTTDHTILGSGQDYSFNTTIDIGVPNAQLLGITIRGYGLDNLTTVRSVAFAVSPFSNFSVDVVPAANYTTSTSFVFSYGADDKYCFIPINPASPSIGRYVNVTVVLKSHTGVLGPLLAKISSIDVAYQYDTESEFRKSIQSYKSDMFGNQYFLVKTDTSDTLNDKRGTFGNIFVRTIGEKIKPLTEFLDFTFFPQETLVSILNTKVTNFEVFYDTLMIFIENYVVIVKCNFDYETGQISPIKNKSYVIKRNYIDRNEALDVGSHGWRGIAITPDAMGIAVAGNDGVYLSYGQYNLAGTWFSESKKTVDIVLYRRNAGFIEIKFYELSLDGKLKLLQIVEPVSLSTYFADPLDQYSEIERPVLTKNPDTDQYHITFLGHREASSPMAINRLVYTKKDAKMVLDGVEIVRPVE